MSNYVKEKVIRLPFPKNLIEKLNVNDCWGCEDFLKETYKNQWNKLNSNFMTINCTDNSNYYLDFVLERRVNVDFGDWGYSFLLNEHDIELYTPIFNKMGIEYDINDLRKVAYNYYNASESPDYYDINAITFESL